MRVEFLVPRLTPLFTPGQTLFINSMPETAKSAVLMLPSLTGGKIDPDTPNFHRGDAIQIVARDADVTNAYLMAQQASDALTIDTKTDIAGSPLGLPFDITVLVVRPTTEPIPYPRSVSDIWEVSVNFVVHWIKGAV